MGRSVFLEDRLWAALFFLEYRLWTALFFSRIPFKGSLFFLEYRLWAALFFLERDGLSQSRHTVGRLLWAEFQRLVAGLREVNPVWDTRRLEQVKGQAFKNFHTWFFSQFQIKGSYSFSVAKNVTLKSTKEVLWDAQ